MSGRPTVAAIDCGTNTIRLLLGALPDVEVRESRIVRLGQGVDATGRLSEEALDRTFAALDDYAGAIREHGATRVRMCATSAVRDADNGADFVRGVEQRLGQPPEILTGEQEAGLSFAGAVRELRGPAREPLLVVDIGGGSTELTLGGREGSADDVRQAHSMDIGSVRLTERHLHTQQRTGAAPTAAEVAACVADIDAALDASPVDVGAAGTMIGVAGTVLTVVAGVLDLPRYDKSRIDQTRLDPAAVTAYVDELVAMSVPDRLRLPFMEEGRADVIAAGALILARVLARARADRLVASEADILDGIAWSLVD